MKEYADDLFLFELHETNNRFNTCSITTNNIFNTNIRNINLNNNQFNIYNINKGVFVPPQRHNSLKEQTMINMINQYQQNVLNNTNINNCDYNNNRFNFSNQTNANIFELANQNMLGNQNQRIFNLNQNRNNTKQI